MKLGFFSLCLIASAMLSAEDHSDMALNCGLREAKKSKKSNSAPMFHPGEDRLAESIYPSYDYPAAIDLQDGSGLFATGSYLYWFVGQEGMNVANAGTFLPSEGFFATAAPNPGGPVFQNFNYSSGYKLGLGYILNQYDHWMFRVDYTSMHSVENQTMVAPSITTPDQIPAFYMFWYLQRGDNGQNFIATQFYSSWHMNLDMIDGTVTRPCYQGNRFVLAPFGGLRAVLLRQNMHVSTQSFLNLADPLTDPAISHNQSHSWGLGPRGGLEARLLLGCGVRLQGELGASLLFTHYSKVFHSEDPVGIISTTPLVYALYDYNCLRPMAEANLGLGWLYYFNDAVAMDLSATYDFNYMWSQNMIHALISEFRAADLFLHGLTLSAALAF